MQRKEPQIDGCGLFGFGIPPHIDMTAIWNQASPRKADCKMTVKHCIS